MSPQKRTKNHRGTPGGFTTSQGFHQAAATTPPSPPPAAVGSPPPPPAANASGRRCAATAPWNCTAPWDGKLLQFMFVTTCGAYHLCVSHISTVIYIYIQTYIYIHISYIYIYIYHIYIYINILFCKDEIHVWCVIEGSLEVQLPTIWTIGKAEGGRVRVRGEEKQ